MISKIKALTTALTTDKEKNLQAPVEMEELSDSEAINVVGGKVQLIPNSTINLGGGFILTYNPKARGGSIDLPPFNPFLNPDYT
ncbi:hypothetical protein [Nostoc sphaeroides]|uniref:Uncharacterized protein n=1 Tax=Nostoc sphaeroides CCNUC1 TaxID=2653204 RepID=A0A5P8VUS2_9NOSO|nr:hypothetical protein [Nostoc sphaeroides]MCC5628753.1 hypothetical protein [Nostoc sphaeroides CHAB 2801]QFS44135.1 hypothetical protein GXM_01608 [Nostoc sphaeroides CCNUC1]